MRVYIGAGADSIAIRVTPLARSAAASSNGASGFSLALDIALWIGRRGPEEAAGKGNADLMPHRSNGDGLGPDWRATPGFRRRAPHAVAHVLFLDVAARGSAAAIGRK